MKSSHNIHPEASYEKLEAWLPPDFNFVQAPAGIEEKKEQLLAIFRPEVEERSSHKTKSSGSRLYSAETSQGFAAWQIGDMDSQPAVILKKEWTFVEFGEKVFAPIVEIEEPIPETKKELALQDVARLEKETVLILEKARLQAEEIILAAQAEADNILLQAEEEIEAQKKAGYEKSRDQANLEIADTLKATHALVGEVQEWKADLMLQGEHIVVEMMKQIAQKMFGEGVELDTHALQNNLNHIMENAHGLGNLNIFLNPRDAKNLDPSWSEYQMLVSGANVKIIPSGKITRGGSFVKGDMGVVDGRVETQLSAILKTFSENDGLDA